MLSDDVCIYITVSMSTSFGEGVYFGVASGNSDTLELYEVGQLDELAPFVEDQLDERYEL